MKLAKDWLSTGSMNAVYRKQGQKFLICLVIALIIFLWGLSASLTEKLYSNALYPFVAEILRAFSGLFPFAIGDVCYVLLIGYVIKCIYVFSKKLYHKQYNHSHRILIPMQVLRFMLILYIAFKLLWGLNYSRPSIATTLGISNNKYNKEELVKLAEFLIHRINHLEKLKQVNTKQQAKTNYTVEALENGAAKAYTKKSKVHSFFHYPHPAVKSALNSWLITKIGLEGYYNPLSGEANINMLLPQEDLPFVTSHEIAHQIGVAREDEANLVGYLVAINSDDLNFQYSGYYAILRNVLFEVRLVTPEDYEALYKTINPGTLQDYKNGIAFWKKYNNQMFGYMSATLDSFLKINNQHKGIASYQDIVLWVYNIHQKEIKD
jgi:hypothetical protein